MASIHSLTTLDSVLKELYRGQKLQDVTYDAAACPLFTMLAKKPHAGRKTPLPIRYGQPVGLGGVLNTAQDNIGEDLFEAFDITTTKNYAVGRIETEAMYASKGDKAAFVDGLVATVDGLFSAMKERVEASLFGNGSRALVTIGSGVATTTITCSNTEDIVNVNVGQKVVTSATATGALTSAAARTVETVDRSAGTFTVDVAFGGTAADGDLVFLEADRYNNDTSTAVSALGIKGLASWLPATAPTSGDSHFSVDRSVDSTRLAGTRYAGSASNLEDAVFGAATELARESGALPDVALMSYQNFRKLAIDLGSKVQRDQSATGQGGFQYLEVYGPRGLIKVVPATFCPNNRVYVLTLSSWQFISMNEPIHIIRMGHGLRALPLAADDGVEIRVGSYANLACDKPGANAVITL